MTAKVLHSKETIEARKKVFREMKAEVVEVEEVNTPTEKAKKAEAEKPE